jgi:hypothetical protein
MISVNCCAVFATISSTVGVVTKIPSSSTDFRSALVVICSRALVLSPACHSGITNWFPASGNAARSTRS